jgi:hypothetical protein
VIYQWSSGVFIIKTPDDHWYISTFYSRDYVIIHYSIARIKTPDDHRRLYSGNVIVNDYVVPAVKCRDIPMVIWRLYSGNAIMNDYVVTPDEHWYISTFYRRDSVIIDNNIARIKMPDDHWYISTFYSQDYVIVNDYVVPAVKPFAVV